MKKVFVAASDSLTLAWSSPLRAAAVSTVVYGLLMGQFAPNGLGQSSYPYFVSLADSFLRGQLHLAQTPLSVEDLILFEGRLYLYWPPFPAAVFLPLVALFGTGVSDAPVTLLSAAANVALVAAILAEMDRKGLAPLVASKRAWLTFFFALGTVHLPLAIYPRVWFTAQILSFTMLGSAYLIVLRSSSARAVLVAGVLLGAAVLTRNSTLMAGIGLLWLSCLNGLKLEWGRFVRQGLLLAVPVAIAVGFLALYNFARFGNPLDAGLKYHLMAEVFVDEFRQYGAFSPHYFTTNFYYNFVFFPYAALFGPGPVTDFLKGGSLFLMSPMYLLAFVGIASRWRNGGAYLAASCLTGLVPMMLLMGTGWVTFGPRYTFDIAVPLAIATAFGASCVHTRVLAYLAMASALIYIPGSLMLGSVLQ